MNLFKRIMNISDKNPQRKK